MLNINLCDAVPPEVREMITTLRRTHVSRFPVDVVCESDRPNVVRFVDSRFPTIRNRVDSCLAVLDYAEYDGDGRRIYKVASRLIQNEKYSSQNHRYHIKETTDIKKVLKLLRDYAKPYSSIEISYKDTGDDLHTDEMLWRDKPLREMNIVFSMSTTELAEEIMYLHSVGVQFRSDKFRRAVTNGIEICKDVKHRKDVRQDSLHVYIQPDGSVTATSSDPKHMEAGAWTYASMEQAPQCVQQQIAMLRMCDERLYVPEVGRKVKDNRFWIHVNPDDFRAQNS
jgi:hypothetical protein